MMTKRLTHGGLALGLFAGLVLFAGGCGQTESVAENKNSNTEKGQPKEKTDPGPTNSVLTKITTPEMDCEVCAKKLIAKVNAVPGVAKVEADIEAHTLTITPKPGETLSPKALWETCVTSGYDPSKLEGPSGMFTSKPEQ
jgi:copper chaperone CopZ